LRDKSCSNVRFLLNAALAASLLLGTPLHAAEPPRIVPELRPLRQALARTQRLSARFKQSRHWAALQDTLVTHGTLRYQKGGALVWHTDPPSESILTLKGRTATFSTPGLGSQETLDLGADPGMARVFDTVSAVLQADLDALDPLFKVDLVHKESPLVLALTPKNAELEKTLKRLKLSFDAKSRLRQVDLEEANGDRTEISFFDHRIQAEAEPQPEGSP
jgi:outer membrane lipoprotein-sorting protein